MERRLSNPKKEAEIFETLTDFTLKENWDKFFTLRGAGDSFEWYADWPSLRDPILSLLPRSYTEADTDTDTIRILVPGCGSSRLSEYVYDLGFRNITNIDFSKVVVSDMLKRYVRSRPEMKWRVMDMTQMQFADEYFDVILDKGGLDALMEPEHGERLGSKYLKEVKRVLKMGGKYLCLTLAESHVMGLLFSEFRFGWETSIHSISLGPGDNSAFQTFMIAIVKQKLGAVKPVISPFNHSALECNTKQVKALINIVEEENRMRNEYSSGEDIIYSFQDLQLGAKGNLKELQPGRRYQLVLGEQGESLYTYKTVLLDAKQQLSPYSYHCGVFIVPKTRAHEWLFTSEEGQWLIVESSKAARLIMVFLDSRHGHSSMDNIQKDLSPLVKCLAPGEEDHGAAIPFMMANDGVKERNVVHQAWIVRKARQRTPVQAYNLAIYPAPSASLPCGSATRLFIRCNSIADTENLITFSKSADCLSLKTKRASEVQEILEEREKSKPHIWTYRTVEEASANWWGMYNRFYKPPPLTDA